MGISFSKDVLGGHGDFSIDADPFFFLSGVTIVGGKAEFSGSGAVLARSTALVIGKMYHIEYTVDAIDVEIRAVCGSTGIGATRNSAGTYSELLPCSGNTTITMQLIGAGTATIDNLVVHEVKNYNRISTALSRNLRV